MARGSPNKRMYLPYQFRDERTSGKCSKRADGRTDGRTDRRTDGHLHLYICEPSATDKNACDTPKYKCLWGLGCAKYWGIFLKNKNFSVSVFTINKKCSIQGVTPLKVPPHPLRMTTGTATLHAPLNNFFRVIYTSYECKCFRAVQNIGEYC